MRRAGIFLIAFLLLLGCVEEEPPAPPTSALGIETMAPGPMFALSSYYTPEEAAVSPAVSVYSLPLNISSIYNSQDLDKLSLSDDAENLLRKNGFVVIDYGRQDDVVKAYKNLKRRDIPIFITTDTVLHLYHIQFDETLKEIEEEEFYDEIKGMSRAMLDASLEHYGASPEGDVREAAKRNTAYFGVGLKLLDPSADIPSFVDATVSDEIRDIEAHSGFSESPIFKYKEDYSQYVPRGHYTRSEKLKKYFKAMMWYGRMSFLLKESQIISAEDAKIQTIGAVLISSSMDSTDYNGRTVRKGWDRIYGITAFFVGVADDLTPYEYGDVISEVYAPFVNQTNLEDESKYLALKAGLAQLRLPQIYGGTGKCEILPPLTAEKADACLAGTQGMRFMGQRYIPDSYMFQNLVFSKVGPFNGTGSPFTMCITPLGTKERCMPLGLDVMAVLGSERAEEIIRERGDADYTGFADRPDYKSQLENLRGEFSNLTVADWNRNLYFSWIYAMTPLLREYGEGYPAFMRTGAWTDKNLNTVLSSWAELRHDTILYAKQSYTMEATALPPVPEKVVGYVEPDPEFYGRMLSLTRMTREGLIDANALSKKAEERLVELENVLSRLKDISEDELEDRELTEDDYEFIRNVGDALDVVVEGVETEGKETTIIADVHTDINTRTVLEEGVGYVDLIVVAYKVPDGRILVGAGPVFSYYEFKHPMSDRLTDEKWKEMLETNPPERPEWIKSFSA